MVRTLDPSTGGVVRAVLLLSDALAQAGHEVEIVSLDLRDSPWLDATRDNGRALGASQSTYGYSPNLMPWLHKEGGRFDRVIVNGIWQYHSFAAWRRYAGSPIPYYVFPHGMLDPWFRRTYPLKHLKKWLYWPWADYRVLRDASAVIFTSEQERIEARRSFWLYRCRERISPLGVEPPHPIRDGLRERFLEKYPVLRNTRILLFLGRLHLKKGCDLLLDAFAEQRNSGEPLALVLAGPDHEGWAERLRAQSARLDLPFPIILTGMLEGGMKAGAFEAADAFILPSHQENFGLSVVEALAAGVPVLISNCVNIWREIDADGAGYVDNDDLAGTTRLIERWVQAAPAVRDTMRENARKCFARRFEVQRAANSLLEVLREPLN